LEKSSNQKIYTDILIIGGGVIGGASAYYLSKKGYKVTVIEKSGIAAGSSGACDGFLFLQSKKDRDIISLTKLSLKSFPGLSEELSYDIEYENCGGLVIFSEHFSREEVEAFYSSRKDLGIGTRIIDGDEMRRAEPFISERITSATFCADEGQVNPIALNQGFCRAAKNNGALVITNQSAVLFDVSSSKNNSHGLLCADPDAADINYNGKNNPNIEGRRLKNSSLTSKRITKVTTSSGTEIFAGEVIICAGAYSGEVGKLLGIYIPVKPRRGSLAVTEALPRMVNHAILDYDYICCKFDENRETGFTVEQTKQGNLLIGSIREFKGFENTYDNLKMAKVLKRSSEIFRQLSEVSIIRIFSGFRPYSEDFKPLIGPAGGFSNLWIASGHEGDGIALSCATGKLITSMVESSISGKDFADSEFEGINIKRFLPSRFGLAAK